MTTREMRIIKVRKDKSVNALVKRDGKTAETRPVTTVKTNAIMEHKIVIAMFQTPSSRLTIVYVLWPKGDTLSRA